MLVNGPTTIEIDANLEARRMETLRPVERFATLKIMPLHTHTVAGQTAKQRPPFPCNPGPNAPLAKFFPVKHARIHIEN